MTSLPFKINTDINANVVNTNLLNATDANITNAFIDNLLLDNVDLPVGGQYKIGGVHVLSTPVQASSVAVGNTVPTGQGAGAGQGNQGDGAIAIGRNAASSSQTANTIVVGSNSGNPSVDANVIVLGSNSNGFAGTDPIGANIILIGNNASCAPGVTNCIGLGTGVFPNQDNQLSLGSAANPLETDAVAGAIATYLSVNVNGTFYKIALYTP